jgi:fermentation-respiration switch protein FrsA (DUF1100 family)
MEQKISITNSKGLRLAGILHTPITTGKHPAILLLHGFTGYKEEGHLSSLAEILASNNFVALRFDASGFGESEGTLEHDYRMSNYFADINSAHMFFQSLPEVESSLIGLWGQSMGGTLAVIYASKHPEIRSVCAVSAPTQMARKGREPRIIAWKKTGWFEKLSSKFGLLRIPYAFIEDAKKWDATIAARLLKAKFLMIVGTADINVLPQNSKELYSAVTGPKEISEIEGMDHFPKRHPESLALVNQTALNFFQKTLANSK